MCCVYVWCVCVVCDVKCGVCVCDVCGLCLCGVYPHIHTYH